MTFYLTYLKDTIGNNYIGINVPSGNVEPHLNDLKEIIGEDDFEQYTKYQQDRDHGDHHITVINVMEYNSLSKKMGMDKFINSLDPIFKYEIDDVKMMGVGTAERNGNRTYFVVCDSEKLDQIRNRYGLPKQDFHITLGFKWKDVFGVRKNQIITKESKFLKLLRNDFYNNENWNFLKSISNFDLNPQSEIIPISIGDNRIKVKCDGYYMDIGLLDDEKYWIMTKYQVEENLPRLSETEISRILKK